MNPKYRKYGVIGLYVALAAVLAALGLYVVFKQTDNLAFQISLGFIVIGLAFFAIMNPQGVRTIFQGKERQFKYGSNALIMSLAVVGILIIVNWLVFNHGKSWDLTQDKENTLTQETVAMLEALPENVTAVAFYSDAPKESARLILEQYKLASNGTFDYKFIDPVKDPVAAQKANITADGTVVLQMGDRQEPVTPLTEEQIDIALVKLINPQSRTVYFLSGHGEHDIASTEDDGISSLTTMLESKNYFVASLNLLVDNKIPDDASVIVIDGPKKPLSQSEVDLIKAYLAQGKALIIMQDSTIQLPPGEDTPDPLAEYIAMDWGLTLNNDLIMDYDSVNPTQAMGNPESYGSSPITRKLGTMNTAFPVARSISATPVSGITQTMLVSTGYNSWGEIDLVDLENIEYDENQDSTGPLALVYTAENTANGSRLVLFGDADFSINVNLSFLGNGDLQVNSIDWATGQENLINLTPRSSTNRVVVSPMQYTIGLIFLMVIIVIPGIVLLAGILVWIQRKKRG